MTPDDAPTATARLTRRFFRETGLANTRFADQYQTLWPGQFEGSGNVSLVLPASAGRLLCDQQQLAQFFQFAAAAYKGTLIDATDLDV